MPTFTKTQDYEASASTVWSLIDDFYAVQAWMPGVASVVKDGDRRTRTITMQDGSRLVERLLDEGKRFHRYHFDDPGSLPVRDFTAQIAVLETGPDRSTIEWTGSFELSPNVTAQEVTDPLLGFIQTCLDQINTLLTG